MPSLSSTVNKIRI